jgi:hypothetical protein
MRIRDPGWKKSGSEIRDKHPGSATREILPFSVSGKDLQHRCQYSYVKIVMQPATDAVFE